MGDRRTTLTPVPNRYSNPGFGLLALTVLAVVSLAGCSTVVRNQASTEQPAKGIAGQHTQPAATADQAQQTAAAAPSAPKLTGEAALVAANPLLKGLPTRDIAILQADAKRMYANHWKTIAERSRYVRGRILPILKEMHAPQQLEVVPVAESGYNPYAFSPVGATGLWQVMPGTASVLGMKAPAGYDARRHVEMSTRGGVQYLLDMYSEFGNWPAAFAAYHRGPGSMERRLREHPWKPEDGLEKMPVPQVTRSYVRGILGLSILLQRGVFKFPKPWETHEVAFDGPIDVNQLARAAGINRDELYRFNPGLNHSQYLNSKVVLHVPDSMLKPLLANADQAAPEYVRIRVRRGDSLYRLAHRHHTSIHDLKHLNPGLTALLHPGQSIMVPASRLNSAHPPMNPLLARGRRIHYRVRHGDNLWDIARRFGTTPKAIARANSIRHTKTLHPGDHLWVLARASIR